MATVSSLSCSYYHTGICYYVCFSAIEYGEIFSSLVLYCSYFQLGQYCHPQAEYFPYLVPSHSRNFIICIRQDLTRDDEILKKRNCSFFFTSDFLV